MDGEVWGNQLGLLIEHFLFGWASYDWTSSFFFQGTFISWCQKEEPLMKWFLLSTSFRSWASFLSPTSPCHRVGGCAGHRRQWPWKDTLRHSYLGLEMERADPDPSASFTVNANNTYYQYNVLCKQKTRIWRRKISFLFMSVDQPWFDN